MTKPISLQARLKKSESAIDSRFSDVVAMLCQQLLEKVIPACAKTEVIEALCSQIGSFNHTQSATKQPAPESEILHKALQETGSWLQSTFSLSQEEDVLMGFLALHTQSPVLQMLCSKAQKVSNTNELIQRLADLLQLPRQAVQRAISHTGSLRILKLIKVEEPSSEQPFMGCLDIRPSISREYLLPNPSEEVFAELLIHRLPESKFAITDFPWINSELQVVMQYLRAVRERGTANTNILLFGPSGCGKSELARVISKACGYEAFDVLATDFEQDTIPDFTRKQLLSRYQRMLAKKDNALIVYEDAEEVFGKYEMERQARKDLFNGGRVPVIWTCERIEQLEPSFLKRFDMKVGVPNLPKEARQILIKQQMTGIQWSDENISKLEKLRQVSPLEISAAAKVMCHLDNESQTPDTLMGLLRGSNNTRPKQVQENKRQGLDSSYSEELTNTSIPMAGIINGIRRTQSARLCFYGLPGTGKTALAQHLADTLGKPLITCGPSDLLGPYVGQTERQIAQAFRRAEQEGGVLLLDEIDSVLPDRKNTRHNFELAMVNEMLIQLENFPGLFIGTTNRLEQMDPAVLRRFDIKVEFLAINPSQVAILLANSGKSLGIEAPELDPHWEEALQRLRNGLTLVPGNFATARRRMLLCADEPSIAELARAVAEEARHAVPESKRAIGFASWADQQVQINDDAVIGH